VPQKKRTEFGDLMGSESEIHNLPISTSPFLKPPKISKVHNSGILYHLDAMGIARDMDIPETPAREDREIFLMKGSSQNEPQKGRNFPTQRRIQRLPLSEDSQTEIENWFSTSQITLGTVIPDEESRNKVKRLLYTYRELNATTLEEIPPTDLYEHKVRLKPGTKPWCVKQQKRWPPNQKYWLDKTVLEGLECGFFEKTVVANGELSDWNAQAILVEKEDTAVTGEYRVTFNYRNVQEDIPGCFVTLLSEAHDYLSHPNHNCFLQCDIKHAYWSVGIYPPHRHYFAFSIPGHGQLQPTRMPQGSVTASFSMNELMYLVLGTIPKSPQAEEAGYDDSEPSLLSSTSPDKLPGTCFYMDDIFSGQNSFEEAYEFLSDHLLPRLLWAQLKLSFKKLKLFMDKIVALGMVHKAGGIVQIKPDRSEKIRNFPVPKDSTDVRKFVGAVGITRRWIKNFSELCRPLSRLTGDVEWKWGDSEQLSFELVRQKAAQVVDMHGWDYRSAVIMYSDASLYGAGCLITQKQGNKEVPILLDSFLFTKTQRNYGVYKRELMAIVEFSRKHEHMLRGSDISTVWTDHKPITYFLQCSHLEGIYARWACELRDLHIQILYIPGERNKVADALSRTIFPDENCEDNLAEYGHVNRNEGEPRWVWKDGKGGYDALLEDHKGPLGSKELKELMGISLEEYANSDASDRLFLSSLCIELQKDGYFLESLPVTSYPISLGNLLDKYRVSVWYKDIVQYILEGSVNPELDSVQKAAFVRRSSRFRIENGKLWYEQGGKLRLCITESEVADVLLRAHDECGHFASAITLRKLGNYYWARMVVDVADYIEGCLQCAKFGTARRSQTLQRVVIDTPMQLWGIDFVGPFPLYEGVPWRYILVIVDYFSRFVWAFLCITDDQKEVIRCLGELFEQEGIPVGFYADPGTHFGADTQTFAKERGALWITSPVAAKKSTGMVEKVNDILQRILKKTGEPHLFAERLRKSVLNLNDREILHLHYSPFEIHRGYQPSPRTLEQDFQTHKLSLLVKAIEALGTDTQTTCIPEGTQWEDLTLQHLSRVTRVREKVKRASRYQKSIQKSRYDRGLKERKFTPGQLVLLYDHKSAGKKLRPSWRGPFVITGYGGEHEKSYTLRQICGTPIPRTFHGDHLKRFRLREGYLVSGREQSLPVYQNIRYGRGSHKLPRDLRTIPGAHNPL
jgi:transposase InsO family protein